MPRTLFLLLTASLVAGSVAAQESWSTVPVQGPGGMVLSCASLEQFARGAFDAADTIFEIPRPAWSGETVQFVSRAGSQCRQQIQDELGRRNLLTEQRRKYLFSFSQAVTGKAEAIRRENTTRQKREAEVASRERALGDAERARASNERRKLTRECEASPEYQRYAAEHRIIEGVAELAGWRENQARERRIAQTGGVRDLRAERNNGEMIVSTSEQIQADFRQYKQDGGRATTPQAVRQTRADPCANTRD